MILHEILVFFILDHWLDLENFFQLEKISLIEFDPAQKVQYYTWISYNKILNYYHNWFPYNVASSISHDGVFDFYRINIDLLWHKFLEHDVNSCIMVDHYFSTISTEINYANGSAVLLTYAILVSYT